MKILYDHQAFGQRYGGISRYFVQLLKEFKNSSILNFDYSLFYSENFYIKEVGFRNYFSLLQKNEFKGKYRLVSFLSKLNQVNSKRLIKKNKYDLFHPTYYDSYFIKYIKNKPFVLTVYDLIHEKYSGIYFNSNDSAINNKKELILKAAKIIAISQNTKKDIVDYYGIYESKIDVIHLANSLNKDFWEKVNIPTKYILFVGVRTRYKNFKVFIKSIASMLLKNKDLHVVCAGGGCFNREELNFFAQLKITPQMIQIFANDNQLVYLYKKALMFVFPSLYEGFGIPVLEAMSCGCPLVISNIGSFKEIAQDSAKYFDPQNSDSIRFAVEEVLFDDRLKKQLVESAIKRAIFFNWGKVASQTKKTYESII